MSAWQTPFTRVPVDHDGVRLPGVVHRLAGLSALDPTADSNLLEMLAHLELLVTRGVLERTESAAVNHYVVSQRGR